MSSTRPARRLLNDSGTLPSPLASPRRSTRIKESPSLESIQGRSAVSRRRSRSKSRVLKDSHGPGAQQEVDFKPSAIGRLGLDIQSEDEEDDYRELSLHRRVSESTMGLDSTFGFDLSQSLLRLRDCTVSTVKDSLQTLTSVKDVKIPEKKQVLRYLRGIDWKKPAFCISLLLLMVIFYRIILFLHKDSDPNRLTVLAGAYLLAPFRQIIEATRLTFLTVPELLNRREPLSEARIDYEILVAKILEHHRFSELVDKLSRQHQTQLEAELTHRLTFELEGLRRRAEAEQLRITGEIEQKIGDVRSALHSQNQQVSSNHELTEEMSRRMSVLAVSIDHLEDRVLQGAVAGSSDSHPHSSVESAVKTAELLELRQRLKHLETLVPDIRSQIQSCCQNQPDVQQIFQAKMSEVFLQNSSVMETLSNHFVSSPEFTSTVENLEAELATLRENMETEVRKEAKKLNDRVEAILVQAREKQKKSTSTSSQRVGDFTLVESIVKEALAKYDADKTGLFDFALESAGGSILTTRCTENYELSSAVLSVWGVPIWWETNTPRSILQPGTAPGQCWAFRGSHGSVVLKLSALITIKAVSLEHISPLSTPDGQLASAPKNFSIAGVSGETVEPLANFTYDKTGDPVQTFWFHTDKRFDTVELTILSNHGNPDYTCIYRFRVHGDLTDENKVH